MQPETHLSRVELYRDADGQFRFRAVARNNEIVSISEGYHHLGDCRDEAVKLWPNITPEEPAE